MRQHPATEWREDGVLLGYISGPFSQLVLRNHQNDNPAKVIETDLIDPITDAEILDSVEYDSQTFTRLLEKRRKDETPEMLAGYDPFSRERYSDPMLAKALTEATGIQQTLAESVVHGHESIHFSISNQYPQLYTKAELDSYILACEMASGFDIEEAGPHIANVNTTQNYSTLAQEAIALEAQAEYLATNLGPEAGAQFRDRYISGARNWLFEPNEPGSKIGSLEHKGALWAYKVVNELWDIPIREVMFRLTTEDTHISPDTVLLTALTGDPSEIRNTDPTTQWEILIEHLNKKADMDPIAIAGGTREYLPRYGTDIDANAVRDSGLQFAEELSKYYSSRKKENIERIGYPRHWVPLFVDSYPGFNSGKSLFDILQSLYITRIGKSRQLLIDPETYNWAVGTKLFDLALDLWRMREQLVMPVIAHSPPIHVRPENLEERLRAPYLDGEYISSRHIAAENKARTLDLLAGVKERMSQEQSDQWRTTIRELRALGAAIMEPDKTTIRRYLS